MGFCVKSLVANDDGIQNYSFGPVTKTAQLENSQLANV